MSQAAPDGVGAMPDPCLSGSLLEYPERGPWGDGGYRGNCTGHMIKDLILRLGAKSVFDPAEGSGTCRQVVGWLNEQRGLGIHYQGRDLKQGWDLLSGDMPGGCFDLVWFHPPYWDIIRYSADPRDLSACPTLEEFESRLSHACNRLAGALRPGGVLAVLIGDKRKGGAYFPLFRSLLYSQRLGELKAIMINKQRNCRSDHIEYKGRDPLFIPIRHEYCLLFRRPAPVYRLARNA